MTKLPRASIPGLDVIRFSAAALVMLYHLGVSDGAAPSGLASLVLRGRAAFPEIFGVAWAGFVGVEIFFVISGFVITFSAAEVTALNFARSRIIRLYPAVWVCATATLLVVLPFHVQKQSFLLRGYLHSIVLFPFGPWVDSVYWTLGIEMGFYAFIFCLILLNIFRHIGLLCYCLGGVSAAYWLLGTIADPSFLSAYLWYRPIELSLVNYGVYFALGMLAYSVMKSGFSITRVGFGVAFVLSAMVEIHYKAVDTTRSFHSAESDFVPFALFLLALGGVAFSLYWRTTDATSRRLRIVGLATYPLYLIHDNVGTGLLGIGLAVGLNRFGALVSAVTLCVGISFYIAIYLEPPIRRFTGKGFDWTLAALASHHNLGKFYHARRIWRNYRHDL